MELVVEKQRISCGNVDVMRGSGPNQENDELVMEV